MIRYLLDTNIAIHMMQGNPRLLATAAEEVADGSVAISTCSVGELHFGIHAAREPEREREAVQELLAALEIMDYDQAAAREYGRLRAAMKQTGQTIPTMDTQIAAVAVANGLTVVSADRHLAMVPDLPVENWLEPSPSAEVSP